MVDWITFAVPLLIVVMGPLVAAGLAKYKNRNILTWTFLPGIMAWCLGLVYRWVLRRGLPYENYQYGTRDGLIVAVMAMSLLTLAFLPRRERLKPTPPWLFWSSIGIYLALIAGVYVKYDTHWLDEEPRLLALIGHHQHWGVVALLPYLLLD